MNCHTSSLFRENGSWKAFFTDAQYTTGVVYITAEADATTAAAYAAAAHGCPVPSYAVAAASAAAAAANLVDLCSSLKVIRGGGSSSYDPLGLFTLIRI